jgi:heterodisulfide reductase subunit B
MKEFPYLPGCALRSRAKEFKLSIEFLCEVLGVKLKEIPNWNCCGATSAYYLNSKLSLILPARNLILASEDGGEIVTPCTLCYHKLKKCSQILEKDRNIRQKLKEEMDVSYFLEVKVRNILEILLEEVGIKEIEKKRKRSLNNLKVACYYGCLLTRPKKISIIEDYENPKFIEDILETLGARAVKWSYKTECCGSALSLPNQKIVSKLVVKIIKMAKEAGADCIVTACPLCQKNLELRQEEAGKNFGFEADFPILYYSELMGISLGYKEAFKWLNMHFIDSQRIFYNYRII